MTRQPTPGVYENYREPGEFGEGVTVRQTLAPEPDLNGARPDVNATDPRHNYKIASAALDAAHKACYRHPERDALGMSHGPFSGVNVALGIIALLEQEVHHLRRIVEKKPPQPREETR